MFVERTFLSIDGIVNGDLSNTAVAGVGFGPSGQRPVGLAIDLQNLGLQRTMPGKIFSR